MCFVLWVVNISSARSALKPKRGPSIATAIIRKSVECCINRKMTEILIEEEVIKNNILHIMWTFLQLLYNVVFSGVNVLLIVTFLGN